MKVSRSSGSLSKEGKGTRVIWFVFVPIQACCSQEKENGHRKDSSIWGEEEKAWRSLISDKCNSNPVDKFTLRISCIDCPLLHFLIGKQCKCLILHLTWTLPAQQKGKGKWGGTRLSDKEPRGESTPGTRLSSHRQEQSLAPAGTKRQICASHNTWVNLQEP